MRWYKRLEVFKTSNNVYDPKNREAWSYDWWQYVREINGIIVFNDYSYSASTRKHQNETWVELCNYEGIDDLENDSRSIVVRTRDSLSGDLKTVRESIVEPLVYEIEKLRLEIERPRITAKGISTRRDQITALERELTVLRKRLKCVVTRELKERCKARARENEKYARKQREIELAKKREINHLQRLQLDAEIGSRTAENELFELTKRKEPQHDNQ